MKINNLASLRRETERLEYKLEIDISKLKTDFQLLRYSLLDSLMKELFGLFSRKKKTTRGASKTTTKTSSKTSSESSKPKRRTRKKE